MGHDPRRGRRPRPVRGRPTRPRGRGHHAPARDRRRADADQAGHGQGRLLPPRRRVGPDPDLRQARQPARGLLQRGLQALARSRRLARHRGHRLPDPHGRGLHRGRPPRAAQQVAQAAARREDGHGRGDGRDHDLQRGLGPRIPLPPALRGPRAAPGGARRVQDAPPDRPHHPALPRRRGLRRGRDAGAPAALRRRRRAPVHDAPQRARHAALPPHRGRAVPQAAARGWLRGRLRDREGLPERGALAVPQPGVHHAGALRRVQGLRLDDGARGADAGGRRRRRGRLYRRAAHGRRDDAHARLLGALPPRPHLRRHRGGHRPPALRRRGGRGRRPRHHRRRRPLHRHRRGPEHGRGQAHRRDLRRGRRADAPPADVHHGLPGRAVAARQAPPLEARPRRALRADRGRQGALQRLLGAQRPARPARPLRRPGLARDRG